MGWQGRGWTPKPRRQVHRVVGVQHRVLGVGHPRHGGRVQTMYPNTAGGHRAPFCTKPMPVGYKGAYTDPNEASTKNAKGRADTASRSLQYHGHHCTNVGAEVGIAPKACQGACGTQITQAPGTLEARADGTLRTMTSPLPSAGQWAVARTVQ